MTVDVQKFADPDAIGAGTGLNWADAYVGMAAACVAEAGAAVNCSNIHEATVVVTSMFTVANETINFSPSGATARFINLSGNVLQYEVKTGTPAVGDDVTGVAGNVNITTIDDTSGGLVTINYRRSAGTKDITPVVVAAVTTLNNHIKLLGDFSLTKISEAVACYLSVGNNTGINCTANHLEVVGVQLEFSPTQNSKRGIDFSGTGLCTVDRSLIWCTATGGNYIRGIIAVSGDLTVTNTVLQDIKRSSQDFKAVYVGGACNLNFYNNIIDNAYTAITNDSTGIVNVINTALLANVESSGTGTTNFDHCASRTGIGTNGIAIADWNDADVYLNIFLKEYGLKFDSLFINAGLGPSLDANVPLFDVEGNSRPNTATTDIGIQYDAALHVDPNAARIVYSFNDSTGLVCVNEQNNRLNGVIGEELVVTYTSPLLVPYQSYSTDGTNHYIAKAGVIEKWNADWSVLLDSNITPYTGYPTAPTTLGGCQFYDNKLYISAEAISSCGSYTVVYVGIYDLLTAGMPLLDYIDTAAEGFEIGAVAVNAVAGHVYAVSYCVSTRIWIYNLASPYEFVGTIEFDYRTFCNGITYEASTNSVYVVASNARYQAGTERIFQCDLSGHLMASWNIPVIDEGEDIDVSTGDFVYNCYPTPKVRTATYPVPPTRVPGRFDCANKYYLDVPQVFDDEFTLIFNLEANSFFAGNTVLDSPISTTQWKAEVDASGLFSFVIDGASPVTYLLPSATTAYEVAITCGGSGLNRTVKLYIDEVLQDTQTQTWLAPPDKRFSLGAGNSNNTKSNCSFFYLAYFPRELTAIEVANYVPPPRPDVVSPVSAGSYSLTGSDVAGLLNIKTEIQSGSFAVTGSATRDLYHQKTNIDSGAFNISGQAIDSLLVFASAIDAGVYLLTGDPVGTLYNQRTGVDSGAFVLSAVNLNTYVTREINSPISAGAFSVTGSAAGSLYHQISGVTAGVFVFTGSDVDTLAAGVIEARSEIIMQTVKTLLTGLTTTGDNVFRGYNYKFDDAELPALLITQDDDEVVSESVATVDWLMTINIAAHIKEAGTDIDRTLNRIRKEVHAALRADHKLGLAFVINTKPEGIAKPDIETDKEKPTATQDIEYSVMYRTGVDDLTL